jgi:hypothetical protein
MFQRQNKGNPPDSGSRSGIFPFMRKRKYPIVAAVLALAFLALPAYLIPRSPPEPTFKGKPLRFWLDQLVRSRMSGVPAVLDTDKTGEAQAAIRAIGTNAIPTLLRMVRAHDSPIKHRLILLSLRQSVIPVHWHTDGEYHFQAAAAFQVLGRSASPAAPELMDIELYDPDPAVRHAADDALFFVQPQPGDPIE